MLDNEISNTNKDKIILEPYWLNFLPPLEKKSILKIGTNKTNNIIALAYCNPESFSCVGESITGTDNLLVKYYKNLDEVPLRAFDLIIVDEPEYLSSARSFSSINAILSKIDRALKSDGILLLCVPEGRHFFIYRYWIRKVIPIFKFNFINYFFCHPSVHNPSVIFPYISNLKWMFVGDSCSNSRFLVLIETIKYFLKNIIFKITRLFCPFLGLVLIAEKSVHNVTRNEDITQIIKANLSSKIELLKEKKKFLIVTLTNRYRQKYQLRFYNLLNCNLFLIVKFALAENKAVAGIRQEFENLTLLSNSRCKELFNRKGIRIPDVLYFGSFPEKELITQTVLTGKDAYVLLMKYKEKNNRKAVIRLLDDIVNMQILIQDICTKQILDSAPKAEKFSFDNYFGISYNWDKTELMSYVQHGDFSMQNILIDISTGEWGVVDWEALAKGYPPLFDLFQLVMSVLFSDVGISHETSAYKKIHSSFVYLFFSKNWFSEHLDKLLKSYCAYFHFDERKIFNYFMVYLIYQHNKYVIKYSIPKYPIPYKEMFAYSIDNEKSFVFK